MGPEVDRTMGDGAGVGGGGEQIILPTEPPWTKYQPHNADLGREPTIYQPPAGLWGMAN